MSEAIRYAVEMRGITKRFGSVTANDRVEICVPARSIHAIIGENGAGKSTAMNILYGFYTADEGQILIDGEAREIHNPKDAIALGLGMVHQHFMLVEPLTVTENIMLGAEPLYSKRFIFKYAGLMLALVVSFVAAVLGLVIKLLLSWIWDISTTYTNTVLAPAYAGFAIGMILGWAQSRSINYRQARARVREISEQYGLKINPDARVKDLSVGQQQRVEILKTLYRGAQILILDEPTAVLTPQEVGEMFAILRGLRDQGKTIIIITHKLHEVLELTDNITVMRDGRTVGNLPTSEATAEGLARMMVGREVLLRVKKDEAKLREPVLTVRGLAVENADGGRALDDISLEVRGGEILGVAGVEGNGQTELIEVLAGLREASAGEVLLEGKRINSLDPRERKQRGVAHIPEDRHRRGLLLTFDLSGNSILGVHRDPPISGAVLLDSGVIVERANRLVREYDVRPTDINLEARALSGGNQQKLIVAREFDINPKLLLVAQPTRGVDIGATEFIHRKLIELRDGGAAVLLVSAELDEVLSLSDRVVVIYEGRIVGHIDPKTVSEAEIGMMMTGSQPGARGQVPGVGAKETADPQQNI
jgi:simple sugar transport system ATP-binding protein